MSYDPENVFARILSGDLPCRKVCETSHSLAFHDVHPITPVHVLVVPKGPYETLADFAGAASDEEIADWVRAAVRVARQEGVADAGYRILISSGVDGGQEIPHLHLHVLGGRPLGAMLAPPPEPEEPQAL